MRGTISGFLKSLFDPEIRIFGRTVGLAEDPFIDRTYRVNGENGAEYKGAKGLRGSYRSAAEAKNELIEYIMNKDRIPVNDRTHRTMLGKYGRDVIGWRDGGIEYAKDRFGEPLTDEQQMVTIAHEYAAGDGHDMTDEQAQAGAVQLLKGFYPRAIPTAMRMWKNARSDPNWN